MAELLANSPVPGKREAVGTLAAELAVGAKGAKALKLAATFAKRTGLRAAGSTTLLITPAAGGEGELIRITTAPGEPTEYDVLARAVEESTEQAWPVGSKVYALPTAASLLAWMIAALTGVITDAMISAAANIADSKLALTTVVKLAGEQTVSGLKNFTGGMTVDGSTGGVGSLVIKGRLVKFGVLKAGIAAPGPVTVNLGSTPYAIWKTAAEAATTVEKLNKTGAEEEPGDGIEVLLENGNPVGGGNITLKHDTLEALAFGGFFFSTGVDVVLLPGHLITLMYSIGGAHPKHWKNISQVV